MSDSIVDRRGSKGKSLPNRQRFLHRHKDTLREAVRRSVDSRGIRDIGKEEQIVIPKKDIQEPVFHHGQGGDREIVHPGNKDWVPGDLIDRPPKGGGGGSGKGQASDSGQGEDDFTFTLSKEEFMQIFFGDLALPNMVRKTLTETPDFFWRRGGFKSDGTPTNLALVRSKRREIGRRIGSGVPAKIQDCLERLELLEWFWEHSEEHEQVDMVTYAAAFAEYERLVAELEEELEKLRARRAHIKLDPLDLRFRDRIKVPIPTTKAVMFCLMDISGSMDEDRKNLSKRFFILLYLFLTRHYEKIDIVFIRHHTQAQEVDEQNFFHATETGGTVASSALVLMDEIIQARYSAAEWNIYGAQASDGDNWHHDSGRCNELMQQKIIPLTQYFAYIQVAEEKQNLWEEYEKVMEAVGKGRFNMKKVSRADQIYPVFRELFEKEST